jgi:DHA3 family macrolide efflux protein-like MFS transporter
MPRNFWRLFQGQLVSHLGTQAFQVMALFYLAKQTGEASAGAAYLALGCIPPVILGPWLAAWSTRFAPRSVLMFCDLFSGALSLPMACALLFGAPSPVVVAGLLCTVTLLACVNALLMPSLQATIPKVVEPQQLTRANGLMVSTQQLAAIAGQGLGGIVYGFAGPVALCLSTAVGFLASASWATRLRGDAVERVPTHAKSSGPVFALLRTSSAFRALALSSAAFNVLYAPYLVLLPFHLASSGELHPQTFGIALAIYAVGNVVGANFSKSLASRFGSALLGPMLMLQGLALGFFGLSHSPSAQMGMMLLMGVLMGVTNVQFLTRAQTCVEPSLVAPALAVLRSCGRLAMPVGYMVVGMSKSWFQATPGSVYMACGALLVIATIPLLNPLRAKSKPAAAELTGSEAAA